MGVVTVPDGMQPGQTIAVLAPDGSRTVKASIPTGLRPGDSFLVRLAKPIRRDIQQSQAQHSIHDQTTPNFASSLDMWLSPADSKRDVESTTHAYANKPLDKDPVESEPRINHPSEENSLEEPNLKILIDPTTEEKRTDNMPALSLNTAPPESPVSPHISQKLLMVQIPPGMTAGQTMHVEVPGEGRTLTVQIPPNVDSFHVSYTPRLRQSFDATTQRDTLSRQQSPTGQKLLLVRVPAGTPAGTTLHVSVPDEPGRILAAQVPPGNVSEFHVSYEARPHLGVTTRRGMLPPANPYTNSGFPRSQEARSNDGSSQLRSMKGSTFSGQQFFSNANSSRPSENSEYRDEGDAV